MRVRRSGWCGIATGEVGRGDARHRGEKGIGYSMCWNDGTSRVSPPFGLRGGRSGFYGMYNTGIWGFGTFLFFSGGGFSGLGWIVDGIFWLWCHRCGAVFRLVAMFIL